MQKREYKKICWNSQLTDGELSAHLTELGLAGWKVINADTSRDDYLLEREIPRDPIMTGRVIKKGQ